MYSKTVGLVSGIDLQIQYPICPHVIRAFFIRNKYKLPATWHARTCTTGTTSATYVYSHVLPSGLLRAHCGAAVTPAGRSDGQGRKAVHLGAQIIPSTPWIWKGCWGVLGCVGMGCVTKRGKKDIRERYQTEKPAFRHALLDARSTMHNCCASY